VKNLLRRLKDGFNIQTETFQIDENKAAVITAPRAIAPWWEQYESVDLILMGTVW
jgi:hypothetical protein